MRMSSQKRFLLAIDYYGYLPMKITSEKRTYPFDDRILQSESLLSLINRYAKLKNIKPEFLIIAKPIYTEGVIARYKETEQRMEEDYREIF